LALLSEQIDGKYEILEKMREGGMGAIYKVRHRLLDEVRVVKVIRSQDPTGEAAERFLREARVAIKLRHPNIAALHDFAVGDDGNGFIVMEFIDGWNLLELLKGYGPPPIPLTLEIARQSLKALGYLHRHKIVHRDVSPDNLMLTRDVDGHPLVKLIDLGIAKALEGSGGVTTTGVFLGKPRYGSPERFSGEGCDERSDLYSFGVVLYELLTGRPPITGNDATSFMAGHLFRPPVDFAETDPQGRVPADLREIVLKSLAKKPDERIASAEDFVWSLTMLHDRFPLSRQDLEAVWGVLLPLGAVEAAPDPPGSTQDRLDLEFGMTKTPATGTATEPATILAISARREASAEHLFSPTVSTRAVPAQSEPPAPDPTRRLPVETAPSLAPAVTTAEIPLREARVAEDLDATWASRRMRTVLPPEPVREPPTPPPPVAVRGAAVAKPSLPRILLTAGAALLALAAVGGGWIWWSGQSAEPVPAAAESAPASDPGDVVPSAVSPTETAGLSDPAAPAAPQPKPEAPRPEATAALDEPKPAEPKPAEPKPVERRVVVPLEPETGSEPDNLLRAGWRGVEPPEAKAAPRCVYPVPARGSGRKIFVKVGALVDESGRVIDTRILDGDPSGLGFNEAAQEAVRKVPFFPATRNEVPGTMWTELICDFVESQPAAPPPANPPAAAPPAAAAPPGE